MNYSDLAGFTGTESYYRGLSYYLTDGTYYVAGKCAAFWLFDAIASHITGFKFKDNLYVRHLDKAADDMPARLNIYLDYDKENDDFNRQHLVATQHFEYTDFFDEFSEERFECLCQWTVLNDKPALVCFLTSEY